MSESVLVVGASSKLGRPVVRRLREQGRTVRAMTRTPANAEPLHVLGAKVVKGDLRDPASLARACEGVDCVVASAHALEGPRANDAIAVDRKGHRDLISAAVAAGVKRFLFASARGAGPDHRVDFFRIKYETEQALLSSRLAATIVRGTAFMETWLEIFGKMLAERGKVMVFGPGTTPVNFVSVEDVAHVLVTALGRDDTIGRTIEVGGPENLKMVEVIEILEVVTGRIIRRTHLPLPVLRVAIPLVRPFHPGASRIIQLGILMNERGLVFGESEAMREFPIERSRFEDVARKRASELGGNF